MRVNGDVRDNSAVGDLDGCVALVTGSSRGIGAAIATTLARHGSAVAVHGRDRAAVDTVVAGIHGDGGHAVGVLGDVTKLDQLDTIRQRIEQELGPVEILVANAGGSFTPPAELEDISEQGWCATVEGNLTATFLTLKCFLPGMKQRGRGSIITIASSAGRQANSRVPMPYGAAKAGIALLNPEPRYPSRAVRYPGQLHRARNDPHRRQSRADPAIAARGDRRPPPAAAARHARRRRRRGRLSRGLPVGLDHGCRARRRRRRRTRLSTPAEPAARLPLAVRVSSGKAAKRNTRANFGCAIAG